jgi:hypothetical protein
MRYLHNKGVFLANSRTANNNANKPLEDKKPNAAAKQGSHPAKRTRASKPKTNSGSVDNTKKYVAVIAAVVIILIFAGAIVYGLRSQPPSQQASLSTFESNFEAANAVGIYSTYGDNTSFASVVGCSTALIEAIAGKSYIHKSFNQIHYFIINQTSCTYATLGPNATTNTGSISNCTAFSETHPSIFLNYSTHTKTIVTKNALYFYGNYTSMLECGITSQIS